jgi:hypothetical protein
MAPVIHFEMYFPLGIFCTNLSASAAGDDHVERAPYDP